MSFQIDLYLNVLCRERKLSSKLKSISSAMSAKKL